MSKANVEGLEVLALMLGFLLLLAVPVAIREMQDRAHLKRVQNRKAGEPVKKRRSYPQSHIGRWARRIVRRVLLGSRRARRHNREDDEYTHEFKEQITESKETTDDARNELYDRARERTWRRFRDYRDDHHDDHDDHDHDHDTGSWPDD